MRTILLALVLFVAGCASNPVGMVHDTTHHLAMTGLFGQGSCSGTAIGPHAILTAEHCISSVYSLSVDGKTVAIKTVLLDHADHAIVITDTWFDDFAYVADEPGQGEQIFICGNPGELTDQCRFGRVSGYQVEDNRRWTLYDINAFFGDSGSAIFDMQGRIVGVVSIMVPQVYGQGYMKLMGGLPLAFTKEQWTKAHG